MNKDNKQSLPAVTLAAIGVVYGDIGTSPLYTLRECLAGHYGFGVERVAVFGFLSLIFWLLNNTGLYATVQQLYGPVTLEGAAREDDNSQFGRHGTWQGSAAWEVVDGYRLLLSYGTTYKAPNLGQLYSAYGGNAQLDPEQSKQWEGGLEGLTGPLDWRLTAYRNDIDDMIAWDTGSENYYNIGKARIKGIEWTCSFTTGVLVHQVTLEYLDPRDAKTNEILARRAKQQVKYQLDWLVANIDWSLNYRYLGQRWDTNYSTNQRVRLGGVSLLGYRGIISAHNPLDGSW